MLFFVFSYFFTVCPANNWKIQTIKTHPSATTEYQIRLLWPQRSTKLVRLHHGDIPMGSSSLSWDRDQKLPTFLSSVTYQNPPHTSWSLLYSSSRFIKRTRKWWPHTHIYWLIQMDGLKSTSLTWCCCCIPLSSEEWMMRGEIPSNRGLSVFPYSKYSLTRLLWCIDGSSSWFHT